MHKSLRVMSDEEKRICQTYVDNNMDLKKTAKQVALTPATLERFISKSKCKTWINYRALEKQRKDKLDFNYKIYKIKRVIDEFIPDDSILDHRVVSVALQAIAESNKMQGHYSAEKVITTNLNMDADLKVTKEAAEQTMRELIQANKREY